MSTTYPFASDDNAEAVALHGSLALRALVGIQSVHDEVLAAVASIGPLKVGTDNSGRDEAEQRRLAAEAVIVDLREHVAGLVAAAIVYLDGRRVAGANVGSEIPTAPRCRTRPGITPSEIASYRRELAAWIGRTMGACMRDAARELRELLAAIDASHPSVAELIPAARNMIDSIHRPRETEA